MIEIQTTPTFDRLFKALPKAIQRKADKKTKIFMQNFFHPGLKTEKLHPKNLNAWSFRVDLHYRIIFEFASPKMAYFKYIGHHNDIYRIF